MRQFRHGVLAAAITLAATACSLSPRYEQPASPVADSWPATRDDVQSQALVRQDGWQAFVVDEELRRLVDLALINNRDLRVALLNVEAARAQYRIERADRLPSLDVSATGTRQRVAPDIDPAGTGGIQESYQSGIGMTAFELDLFGRVRSLSTAALNEYLATEEAARSARITLISEVIQAYAQREGAYRALILTREIEESRVEAQRRIALRRTAGVASALEEAESESLARQSAADSERLDRQYRQATNALATLVGTSGGVSAFETPAGDATPMVSELEAGVPSEILAQRPDVRAAEHRLKARNANIGAARAAFFPRISLTGAFGSASDAFSDLYSSGSRTWSFSPQITLPIFSGGRNAANLDLAQTRKDVAVAEYEKSIQVAFQEVADAIAAKETLRREEVELGAVARNSATASRLAEARYRAGLDSYLRYLDAQRTLYSSEIAAIESFTQRQIALTQLFRAMGGAWYGPADVES